MLMITRRDGLSIVVPSKYSPHADLHMVFLLGDCYDQEVDEAYWQEVKGVQSLCLPVEQLTTEEREVLPKGAAQLFWRTNSGRYVTIAQVPEDLNLIPGYYVIVASDYAPSDDVGVLFLDDLEYDTARISPDDKKKLHEVIMGIVRNNLALQAKHNGEVK